MTGSLESSIFVFLVIGAYSSLAQQGTKGSYHLSVHPGNETGAYCYKRVPYNPSRSQYNGTGSYPEAGHGGYNSLNDTTVYNTGYITILDCCYGFHRNPSTNRCESQSEMHCDGNCYGGSCVQGVCTCQPGWNAIEGTCKPICRRPCPDNAYCSSPDVCECNYGWEQSRYGDCRPSCPDGCVNGDCVAPRVCRCRPGFVMDERSRRCEAMCERGCTHGQCVAPGMCQCDPGYSNLPNDRETCVEECRPGYNRDSYGRCVPECRHGCPANSRCESPDSCVCISGFEMDYRNNRCMPAGTQQSGGRYQDGNQRGGGYEDGNRRGGGYEDGNQRGGGHEDGNRRGGGHEDGNRRGGGYEDGNQRGGGHEDGNQSSRRRPEDQQSGRGQQERQCDRPCINGICMGYNICSCNEGYVPDPRDPSRTRCIPSCPGGCPNGSCSGPNFCICKPGYIKDRSVKGSQACVQQYHY